MIEIGYAAETPSGILDNAPEGAAELLPGVGATRRRLGDLDGPNETIALIADAPTWVQIGAAIGAFVGILAMTFVNELAKEAAKDAWKEKARPAGGVKGAFLHPVAKLASAFAAMLHRPGTSATFVVKSNTQFPCQQPGINIPTAGPEEILWRLMLTAYHAPAIQGETEKLFRENPKAYVDPNPGRAHSIPL